MIEKIIIAIFVAVVVVLVGLPILAMIMPDSHTYGDCVFVAAHPTDLIPVPEGMNSESVGIVFGAGAGQDDLRGWWQEIDGSYQRVAYCIEG